MLENIAGADHNLLYTVASKLICILLIVSIAMTKTYAIFSELMIGISSTAGSRIWLDAPHHCCSQGVFTSSCSANGRE
jgi:hypothetical protein